MSEVAGFVDLPKARTMVRAIRLRTSLSLVRASASRALELLNEGVDPDGDVGAPLVESCVGLAQRDLQRGIGGEAIDLVESQHVREDELLEGVDLVLQLLNALGVGLQHGLFSSGDGAKRMQPADAGHRLCEVTK